MAKREKTALIFGATYIFIMSIGMLIMHFIFKYSYENPYMAKILLFFELIMSIVAFIGYKK